MTFQCCQDYKKVLNGGLKSNIKVFIVKFEKGHADIVRNMAWPNMDYDVLDMKGNEWAGVSKIKGLFKKIFFQAK